jgi:hypothetical protein
VKNFRDFIYNNSTTFLHRKKEKFDLIQDDYKRDYSLTIRNYKKYILIDPNNNEIMVENFYKFCNENNLKATTMHNLLSGRCKITKNGWKFKNKII